ncbi:RING finger domain-containing protein [Tetraselmis virus 1]|uniref:RING finger domain-containing protein n=1 Tax=Tetraselmis virus 1 TaxID=2060617 RepID=A0A2P0VN68_9VIRU|nr:RING finger domain-containing protein [Tetraselmis virus 1]AUF82189.1 RING finger domain-containing protein [Tetraselmis virus 1]
MYSYYKMSDSSSNSEDDKDYPLCCICLSQKGEMISCPRSNNTHFYHEECIQKWSWKNPTCPYCRADLEPKGKNWRPLRWARRNASTFVTLSVQCVLVYVAVKIVRSGN